LAKYAGQLAIRSEGAGNEGAEGKEEAEDDGYRRKLFLCWQP